MIQKGKYYLITTDGWFVAPDGEYYTAVWGMAEIITTEQAFDFKPSRPSTNWFVSVGKEPDKSIIIAGCRIHFAIRCDKRPREILKTYKDKETGLDKPVNKIYFTV